MLLLWVAGCSQPQAADAIYRGGVILTMGDARPRAEAIAVAGGRILAVGDAERVLEHRGEATRVVDLQGRTLLPGFVDSHSHLLLTAIKLATVAMDPPPAGTVTSIADVQAAFRRELAANPRGPDDWLLGWGYDNAMLSDGRHPTRADLDRVSAEVPILLVHFSAHQSVLNSRALELMEIDADSEAPEGGVIQRRPGSREPNGILEETAHAPVMLFAMGTVLGDPVRFRSLVARAVELYAAAGFTTVSELAATPETVTTLRRLAAEGAFPMDVVAFEIYLTASADDVAREFSTHYVDRFRVAGCKFNLDGGSPGRTAYLREPYHRQLPGEDRYRGYSSIEDQERLNDLVAACYERNLPTAIHALGDAAVDQCIAAVAEAERRFPAEDRRTQLIHLQQVQEDQFDALAKLDVTLTFQVAHNYYFGDLHREVTFGPERTARLNPVRSALDRGMSVTLHHDSPVHPVDQLVLVWAAVNRVTRSGRVIGPAQRITVAEALRASTREAAYQLFEEDDKGTLEPGKLADFVILDRNPLEVDPMELKHLRVVETIKEGETIHSARAVPDAIRGMPPPAGR